MRVKVKDVDAMLKALPAPDGMNRWLVVKDRGDGRRFGFYQHPE